MTVGATFISVEHSAVWPVFVSTITLCVNASAPACVTSFVYGEASASPSSVTPVTRAPCPASGTTVRSDDCPRATSAGSALISQLGHPTAIVPLMESSSRSPREVSAMHLAVTVKSPSSSKGKETLPTPAASSLPSGSLTVTEAVPSVHELWKSNVLSVQDRPPMSRSSVTLGNGCSARSARFPHTFGTIIEYQRPFDSNRISQAGNASSPAQHRFVPTVGVAPRSRKNIH